MVLGHVVQEFGTRYTYDNVSYSYNYLSYISTWPLITHTLKQVELLYYYGFTLHIWHGWLQIFIGSLPNEQQCRKLMYYKVSGVESFNCLNQHYIQFSSRNSIQVLNGQFQECCSVSSVHNECSEAHFQECVGKFIELTLPPSSLSPPPPSSFLSSSSLPSSSKCVYDGKALNRLYRNLSTRCPIPSTTSKYHTEYHSANCQFKSWFHSANWLDGVKSSGLIRLQVR